jgi:hypothetical protein
MKQLLLAAISFALVGQAFCDTTPSKAQYLLTGCARQQSGDEGQPAQKDMQKENGQKTPETPS